MLHEIARRGNGARIGWRSPSMSGFFPAPEITGARFRMYPGGFENRVLGSSAAYMNAARGSAAGAPGWEEERSPLSKGSQRKRSGSRRKPAASRPKAGPPGTDPEAGPGLPWAKWVEALGNDSPEEHSPATAREAEERLRAATLAAERARQMREMARATAEAASAAAGAPGRSAPKRPPTRDPRRTMAPPRHDPEGAVARAPLGFTASPGATLARALAPPPPPPSAPASGADRARDDRLRDDPLPHRYHDDRLTLLCRDPHWLHAYWDITPANLARARALLAAPAALVLRVHHFPALTGGQEGSFDIEVDSEERNWYVHGAHPGHDFEMEIGLKSAGGRFVELARSNRVRAPLDQMSDVLDEEWRNLAADDERMYRLSGGYQGRVGTASGVTPELVARREMLSSGAVSSLSLPITPTRRGFWFVVDTEIVVYGATEPGASVTCQGRPVPLREDGTFTLRFALPDGTQHIDCAALSADRIETITITPAIDKRTAREERRGDDPNRD